MGWGILIAGAIALWIAIAVYSTIKRRERLMAKYHDPELVDKLMRGAIWQGQTSEQLVDSIGKPVVIDERVLKSKTKETWKYQKKGANRFGLRIIVENNIVVGWEHKG